MHLPTHRASLSPSTRDKGFSEMLQLVARVGRLGSKALPSPTLGIRASMINLPMILTEEYTLNPAVRSFTRCLLESKTLTLLYDCHPNNTIWLHKGLRYYTIAIITSTLLCDCQKTWLVGIHILKPLDFLRTCSRTPGFAGEARCGA